MITATSSLVEVAFAVGTALDRAGVVAVLTGGSAATYHAPDAVQSLDLDFVITMHAGPGESALIALGYTRVGDYYEHSESQFSLEFPPGPLGIGSDLIHTWDTVRRQEQVLHVLSATDSCRDRLAQFLFWNDFSALEQAIAIQRAKPSEVDLSAVGTWCRHEGGGAQFELFELRIHAPRS